LNDGERSVMPAPAKLGWLLYPICQRFRPPVAPDLIGIKSGKSAAHYARDAAADRIVDAQIDLYCP
jgi:hypothetical protein